jgi:predicted protein tyrosine phosphatase
MNKVRYGVHSNQFQGEYKRVLCVCSAGILRSATAAHLLCGDPYNFNTRNAGTASYALIPVTEDLLQWADEIICMEREHKEYVEKKLEEFKLLAVPIVTLYIEDIYEYRDAKLVELIQTAYNKYQASLLPVNDNF